MASELIRFLSGANRWTILELDENEAVASLTQTWRLTFGRDPDFSTTGDATTGFHIQLDDGERGLIISRSANNDASQAASRLIAAKYQLAEVRRLTRPPYGTAATASDESDWTIDLEPRPYNLAAVSVWPPEPERPVLDRIVLEHTNEPGRFVHRSRRSRSVHWCLPAENLEDALTFASVQGATGWITRNAANEPQPLTMRFRAVAAALLDQAAASRRKDTSE